MEEGLGKNMSERCSTSITSSLQATQNEMIGNSEQWDPVWAVALTQTALSHSSLTENVFCSLFRGSEASAASPSPRAGGQAGPAAVFQPQLRPGL